VCLLVRKIDRAKWMQNDILGGETVSADAITNCMKTTGNTLSAWQIPGEAAVSDAVLAMASEFRHLDTIDVALLDQSSLHDAGLRVVESPGRTRVQRLVRTHRDIAYLDYDSLGTMARLIVECRDHKIRRFTKGALKSLLKQAIEEGSVNAQDLEESLRSKVC
jgi:hypothetical protein